MTGLARTQAPRPAGKGAKPISITIKLLVVVNWAAQDLMPTGPVPVLPLPSVLTCSSAPGACSVNPVLKHSAWFCDSPWHMGTSFFPCQSQTPQVCRGESLLLPAPCYISSSSLPRLGQPEGLRLSCVSCGRPSLRSKPAALMANVPWFPTTCFVPQHWSGRGAAGENLSELCALWQAAPHLPAAGRAPPSWGAQGCDGSVM